MISETLISLPYLKEQVILHARTGGYGGKGGKWAAAAASLIREYGCKTVLDYGSGEGQFADVLSCADLDVDIREYDPAMIGKDHLPKPADLVNCTDVLEHVEPERLDAVLAHLKSLARKVALVVIATRPSGKVLTDGRNAHLILEQDDWWQARLEQAGFTVWPGPKSHSLKPSRECVAVLTS